MKDYRKEFIELFKKYGSVNPRKTSGTAGGELVSAVNAIAYRYYNDGDLFWTNQIPLVSLAAGYVMSSEFKNTIVGKWLKKLDGEDYQDRDVEKLIKFTVDLLATGEYWYKTSRYIADNVSKKYVRTHWFDQSDDEEE